MPMGSLKSVDKVEILSVMDNSIDVLMGSTPVAAGSRVPAWPTFPTPLPFRTSATTRKEVQPTSLLTLRMPATFMARILYPAPVSSAPGYGPPLR